MDTYYQESDELLGLPILSDKEDNFLKSDKLKTYSFRNVRKEYLDFGKRFNELISDSKNIEVYLEGTVVALEQNKDAVEGVLVKTLSGNEFSVKGKIVILACGGIENARLLLLNNIGNEFDQVGRYYMDHPKGDVGSITINPKLMSSQNIGLGLSDIAQRENRALNGHLLFPPIYRRNERLMKLPRIIRIVARRILQLLYGSPKVISSFAIRSRMEQSPRPENRITLGEALDAFGNRLPKIHWTISDFDKNSMIVLHKILKEELQGGGRHPY